MISRVTVRLIVESELRERNAVISHSLSCAVGDAPTQVPGRIVAASFAI